MYDIINIKALKPQKMVMEYWNADSDLEIGMWQAFSKIDKRFL